MLLIGGRGHTRIDKAAQKTLGRVASEDVKDVDCFQAVLATRGDDELAASTRDAWEVVKEGGNVEYGIAGLDLFLEKLHLCRKLVLYDARPLLDRQSDQTIPHHPKKGSSTYIDEGVIFAIDEHMPRWRFGLGGQ